MTTDIGTPMICDMERPRSFSKNNVVRDAMQFTPTFNLANTVIFFGKDKLEHALKMPMKYTTWQP